MQNLTLSPEGRALKTMTRLLVKAVGGDEAAAAATRVGKSQIQNYYSPHSPSFMPIDVLVELGEASGELPGVLQELARRFGHTLVPISQAAGAALGPSMARVAAEFGEAFATYSEVYADGVVTPEESAQLDRELGDVDRAVEGARAALAKSARG